MSDPKDNAPRRRFVIPLTGGGRRSSGKLSDIGGMDDGRRAKKGGGCLKSLLIGVVLIAILAIGAGVGGFFYWRNYQTKPAYSVALMFNAALNSDQSGFDEVVDSDRVSDDLASQVTDKAINQFGGVLTDDIKDQIKSVVQKFLPDIKERAHKELMGEVRDKGQKLQGKPFVAMALMVPYVMTVKQDGDSATVVAPADAGGTELTLQKNGDRWKVVGVKDDATVAKILSYLATDLPSATDIILKPQKKQPKKRN